MNRNYFAAVMSAFLVGVATTAILLPNVDDDDSARTSAAVSTDAATRDGAASDGVGTGGDSIDVAESVESTAVDSPTVTGGAGRSPRASAPAASGAAAAAGVSTGSTADDAVPAPEFRGVTNNKVRIGVVNLDSKALGPVCPRCANGPAAEGLATSALLKAWQRDGLSKVHGREIELVQATYDITSAEEARAACRKMVEAKVLMVIGNTWGSVTECLTSEFKIPAVAGYSPGTDKTLLAFKPFAMTLNGTTDLIFRNFPYFLRDKGFLKAGNVFGLYNSCNPAMQESANALREGMKQMGFPFAVDQCYEFGNNSSDGVAVAQFRRAGVTHAIIPPTILQPAGFQTVAEGQGYRPVYPTPDSVLADSDALADVTYSANSHDRNLLMAQRPWDWVKRKPATPATKNAAYCMAAYQEFNKRELDVFDNDAEVRYSLDMCGIFTTAREALVNAGRVLNDQTFIRGMYGIKNLEASFWMSLGGWSPDRPTGNQIWLTKEFRKERWPVHNNYWGAISGISKWWIP